MLGFAFRQGSQACQGVFKVNQWANLIVCQSYSPANAAIALVKRRYLAGDLLQPFLAAFNLARGGSFSNEPTPIHLRVEVAVAIIAAHETAAGNGSAVGAQLIQGAALDILAEEQVNQGASGRVVGGNFAGEG